MHVADILSTPPPFQEDYCLTELRRSLLVWGYRLGFHQFLEH